MEWITTRQLEEMGVSSATAYKSETDLTPNDLNCIEVQLENLIQRQRLLFTLLEAEHGQRTALRRRA
ncbi:MAG: hypothetical protein WBV94_07320 [Blastocatellia bacterium]